MFDDIFFKLYHCEPEDEIADVMPVAGPSFAYKSEFLEEEEDTKNDFSSISPEICYSSSSDGESVDGGFRRNPRRSGAVDLMRARAPKQSKRSRIVKNYYSRLRARENRSGESKDVYDRFDGRLDLFGSRDPIVDRQQSRHREPLADFAFLSYDDGPFAFLRKNDHQETDDDDYEENIETENEGIDENKIKQEPTTFSLPQLKIIQLSDLITEPPRLQKPVPKKKPKSRVRKVVETPKISIEPSRNKNKIIAEINGIKTISYDIEEQLPPGVRASNLSDSGSSTFQMAYFDRARDDAMKNYVKMFETQASWKVKHQDELFDIKNPRLSDSSSSDSSSSSTDQTSTDSSSDSDSSSTSEDTFSTSSSQSSSTDFSCSSCTSSSSSSTSSQSFSHPVKKEKSDTDGSEKISRKISNISSNSDKTIKVEAIASPSSSLDGDRTWRPIDNLSDDDD